MLSVDVMCISANTIVEMINNPFLFLTSLYVPLNINYSAIGANKMIFIDINILS